MTNHSKKTPDVIIFSGQEFPVEKLANGNTRVKVTQDMVHAMRGYDTEQETDRKRRWVSLSPEERAAIESEDIPF